MTRDTEDDQRQALRELWPRIGGYCEQHGLSRTVLLAGLDGIPVDGGKVRYLRENLLLSSQNLADKIGKHRDTITKIENGRRNPSAAVLSALARALCCRPEDLLLNRK